MTESSINAPAERLEEITLKHPHRHGGDEFPAGAKIKVRPGQAKRIREAEKRIEEEARPAK